MPGKLAGRARDIRDGRLVPAPPRDAATVMLLRPAPAGTEVYLLRRLSSMAFAPGAFVFPGGKVDERDSEGGHGWAGPPPDLLAPALGGPAAGAAALVRAAVRETFEECGVLLASPADDPAGPAVDTAVDTAVGTGADWEADRQALAAGSVSLAELLIRRDLVLRGDLLRPWSRWITPEAEERRYDTRFFVATMPAGQRAAGGTGESDRAAWLRPAAALEAAEAGELTMLPPTRITLRELAAYPDVPAVMAADRPITPRRPVVVLDGDRAWLSLPDGSDDD
ncbi:MAG TPA: NUDIX hydrolase [Streptosporangiaceae bacterium]